MPNSNNIIIQEVQETIYPNSLYACECLARLEMHTVVSGSLLYLTSLYVNFGQQEFYGRNAPTGHVLASHRFEFCVSLLIFKVWRMFYSFQNLAEFNLKNIIIKFASYLLCLLKLFLRDITLPYVASENVKEM